MEPDYNQLWRNLNNDCQTPDAHFYAFFEDSLNQFISANANPMQPTNNTQEQNNGLNNNGQNVASIK